MVDSALSENLQSAIREINFLYDRENVQPEEQSQEPGVNTADKLSYSGS